MTLDQKPKQRGKEIDIDLLVFIERYASDLLKWDLISFFARNPDLQDTADNVAHGIGRDPRVVRSELGDLVILGILDWKHLDGDRIYHLTQRPGLRQQALKFARHLNGPYAEKALRSNSR